MKISIKKSSIVRPAKDTPKRTIWNSNLDLLVPRIHIPTVYFYKPNGSSNFFEAHVLKEALSQVLMPFYPLAGRLGTDENGRIEIHCNAKGVLFIEADETTCVIDDFGDFTPCLEMMHLVPSIDYSLDISSYPLLTVQVTYFKCGGVCLGVFFHHTIADGTSAIHFINSWSEIARGISISITPFVERTLLEARVPPVPTFHHIEYDAPPTMITPVQLSPKSTCTKILKITPDQISTLKSKSKKNKNLTIHYSTYETLAAHIWRCMCKARDLKNDQATKLYIATDGRARLNPPLPRGYFGNVLFTSTVTKLCGEIQSNPLKDTIEKIHEALKRMDDEYLRSALDLLEVQPDLTAMMRGANTFKCPNLNVVSWMKLPIHDADFGWGRPIYMGPASVVFEGMGYILPSPSNDGILWLIICLEANHMQLFQNLLYDL